MRKASCSEAPSPLSDEDVTRENLFRKKCENKYWVALDKELLGKGVSGEVHRACFCAKDEDSRCNYAVKTETLLSSDLSERSRILTEIIASVIAGNNGLAPQVYDFWFCKREDKRPVSFLVMDLLEGSTLAHYLEENRDNMSPSLLEKIWIRVIESILQLHDLGIYHGDLHRKNLWISGNPQTANDPFDIYLFDFGKAQLFPPSSVPSFYQLRDFEKLRTFLRPLFAKRRFASDLCSKAPFRRMDLCSKGERERQRESKERETQLPTTTPSLRRQSKSDPTSSLPSFARRRLPAAPPSSSLHSPPPTGSSRDVLSLRSWRS